jgi:hypothetical protein
MKRILFLTLAAAFFTSCERATAPATHGPPAYDLTAAASTTFSGEATVLQAAVLGLPPIVVGRAGPLPESGGAEESSVLSVSRDETFGLASAEVVHAAVVGQGRRSSAEAFVANPSLTVAGNAIEADVLRSQAEARCDGGQASASGSSEVAGLVINGSPIAVSGNPNQTVDLPGLRVVINEQFGSASGNRADITVNALHVTAFNPLSGETLADVIISSAHADIRCAAACPPPAGDFVTGGGWITGTPSGARANFGVAGGIRHGEFWGHLTYIDHGPGGVKVKGTGVTSYEDIGPTSRRIKGTAEVDRVGGIEYTVEVTDAGEPGRDDTFSITLSNGYSASGRLAGGNIQLHVKPDACP